MYQSYDWRSAYRGDQYRPSPNSPQTVVHAPSRSPLVSMNYPGNAPYYHSEEQSRFQAGNRGNGVSSSKPSGVEDFDSESIPDVFTALVKQLLDDIDSDMVEAPAQSQFPNVSEEEETIGELAIKLADLALMDSPSYEYSLPASYACKPLPAAKSVQSKSTTVGAASEKPKFKHIHMKDQQAPFKINQHVASDHKFNRIYFKERQGSSVPFQGFGTVFTKGNGNAGNVRRKKATSRSPFQHSGAGGSSWMSLPPFKSTSSSTGSKSDGSSSSDSSVHRESVPNPSSLYFTKYKPLPRRGDSEEDTFKPKQIHRPRKTYSSSSSSSGGRGKFSECVFCKTNGETSAIYRGHVLKDERGRTVCKVLQKYICPLCGATGSNAHTVKYCPKNKNPPPIATMTTLKAMRTSTGRKRFGHGSGQARHFDNHFLSA